MPKTEEGICDICANYDECTETEEGDFLCPKCLNPGDSQPMDRVVSFETVNFIEEDDDDF